MPPGTLPAQPPAHSIEQETDAIKALVDYAEGQGSRNAARYYFSLSKLADKTAGIENRDMATIEQLGTLAGCSFAYWFYMI